MHLPTLLGPASPPKLELRPFRGAQIGTMVQMVARIITADILMANWSAQDDGTFTEPKFYTDGSDSTKLV